MTTHASRRRVLIGAAWSAPAITMASAVPAMAASTSATMGADNATPPQVAGPVLRVATNVRNSGPGPTTNLMASVEITAPDAASWGANPTAVPTDFLGGASNTSTNWSFVSVTGTGATRTFLFDANTEFAPNGPTRYFDYEFNTGGGNIGPGTAVRSFIPGGTGTSAQITTNYAAAARAGRSPVIGRD